MLESRVTLQQAGLEIWTETHDSDYEDNGVNILLDANENANGPGLQLTDGQHLDLSNDLTNGYSKAHSADLDLSRLNRYPDP